MKAPSLGSLRWNWKAPRLGGRRWLDVADALRPKGGDRLELWLPRDWPAEDRELRWRRTEAGGAVRQGSQRGLEGLAAADEILVWTPAAETLLLRARLPTRSAAKIAQALPFALEDQLIDAPEKLHFAFVHEADGALAVAVTRRERMEGWLAGLAAAGLAPARLAPVTLSLPLADRSWTLAFRDGEMVLRSGLHSGFGGPREPQPPGWLHTALAEARADAKAPERILLVDAPGDLDAGAWRTALGLPLEALAAAQAAVPEAPLDLLQQRYAQRRGRGAALQRAYLPAAALLAAWLVLTLVLDAVEWGRTAYRAHAADSEMRAILMKSFPDTRVIVDPAEQMRRGLDALGAKSGAASPGDMLFLLARASPAFERQARLRVQAIDYADKTLGVRMAATQGDAEALAGALRARSLDVAVDRSGGEARLQLRAAGSKGGKP
ncbi:MAG TPA: type II secretion system protein GspL [Burkholderiales bacterium]|nr:type II secretion system protein GspL [Burkholderiales bacterium]